MSRNCPGGKGQGGAKKQRSLWSTVPQEQTAPRVSIVPQENAMMEEEEAALKDQIACLQCQLAAWQVRADLKGKGRAI